MAEHTTRRGVRHKLARGPAPMGWTPVMMVFACGLLPPILLHVPPSSTLTWWTDVISATRDTAWVPAAVSAAVAASAALVNVRLSVIAGPSSSLPALSRVGRPIAWLAAAAVAGYALGMLPLVGYALADSGVPDMTTVWAIGSAVLSVAIWPALGYLCGVLAGRVRGVMLAIVVTLVVNYLPIAFSTTRAAVPGLSFLAPAPIWNLEFPQLGWVVPVSVSMARACLFGLVIFALLHCAAAAVRALGRPGRREWLGGIAALLPALALGGYLIARQPDLVVPDPHREIDCTEAADRWTICADRRAQPLTEMAIGAATAVGRIAVPAVPSTVAAWGVHDDDLTRFAGTPITPISVNSHLSPDELESELIRFFADEASGWPGCLAELDGIPPSQFLPAELSTGLDVQSELSAAIVSRATDVEDVTSFARLGEDELSGWLDENRVAIDSCRASLP